LVLEIVIKGSKRGGKAPSLESLPPLLVKERGTKVEDSLRGKVNKNLKGDRGKESLLN
jgi:hypothetical protein